MSLCKTVLHEESERSLVCFCRVSFALLRSGMKRLRGSRQHVRGRLEIGCPMLAVAEGKFQDPTSLNKQNINCSLTSQPSRPGLPFIRPLCGYSCSL